ncbi:tyrosine-type recombinase/integrase [Heliobacterium mobile]|nr:tyrosine-type recombinase/integrase [Heliobacterium mobile]
MSTPRLQDQIEAYGRYLAYERRLSPNSVRKYQYSLNRLHRFLKGTYFSGSDPSLSDVQTLHIRRFIAYLSKECQCERTTLVSFIKDLRAFFAYALAEGLIVKNPLQSIEPPRLPERPPKSLCPRELEKLFAAVNLNHRSGQRDMILIQTLYYTGLRASELARLQVFDISPQYDRLFIRQGKGQKDRCLPIHPQLQVYLKDYLENRSDPSPYLFSSNRGNPLTNFRIAHIIKKYVRQAGLSESISTHSLRHSFATHLIQSGVKMNYVCDLLGHESMDTTSIYVHRTVDDLTKLIAKI